MRHPWVVHRERKVLTQEAIASELNVNRQTVIRLEQSLFHSPSDEVLEALSRIYGVSQLELRLEYDEYKMYQRALFKSDHKSFWLALAGYEGAEHPLVWYREQYELSRLAFCRALCLDYSPVADYEANKQRSIPLELMLACNEMSWDYLPLEKAVSDWRLKGHADK